MVNDLSGDILVDQIPDTVATRCLLNLIGSLEACKNDEDIQLLFTDADGPAFEQLISSSDWGPIEVITMKNRNILINVLIYQERKKNESDVLGTAIHDLWKIFE